MVFIRAALASLLVTLVAGAAEPFWIVQHGSLVTTRLDSIISPGAVSGHPHAIVGASSFGPEYTYEKSQAATCVSGNVNVDKSNYWIPQLYRKQPGGGFKLIRNSGANTYYLLRRQEGEPVYEFPPGFRMVAGDPSRISVNTSDPAQVAIRYACLGVSGPETNEFPKQRCPGGLRAEVFFPHCWDGKNNWLEGSKHVAYSSEGQFDGGGKCPDSHPKRIMSIFYEFFFDEDEDYEEGARVWATGDDLGYSLHGDFVNGWPEGLFTEILGYGETCSVGFSLEKCPALKPHMQDQGKCTYTGTIVDEEIGRDTVIQAIPGNNPVWGRSGAKQPAADYVESAKLRTVNDPTTFDGPGPGKQYAQIAAGNIHIATVPGDPAFTGATSIAGDGATQGVANGGNTATQNATATATASTAVTSASASIADSITATFALPSASAATSASVTSTVLGNNLAAESGATTTSTSPSASGKKTCLAKRRLKQ